MKGVMNIVSQVELQGKEIKILTSHCVDTVVAHDLVSSPDLLATLACE